MFRLILLVAFAAVCNAGIANYNGAAVIAPTITSESQNVHRSYGNLQQISTQYKSIDTPYSSVSKSDVRVSNPGIPVAHAQPVAYHAPAAYHAAPVYQQAYHAPATAYHHAPAAAVVASAPATTLLGVKYSPSTSVSHMTYSAPIISYAW
ncbi:hypothetical protein PVAND_014202 [Polypedilum vanderplanki]|uniref:Uncharacterized protein n=1 Tax=Polypedilum vanderplanki TaxID=319348 RepID=A0A9J6CSX3_POLVA|nr:hypothetical protein PVAND_014202 [Polypedilum vanderplanki]